MSVFYGSDTTCVSDTPLIDAQVTDPNILIGQRIARLLTTPRGSLGSIGDDPNRGHDIRALINAKFTPSLIAQEQALIVAECLQDEEVQDATCVVTQSNGVITIGLNLVGASGPFQLTLNVSALTTSLVFGF